jgi:hypothetical protein
MPDNLEEYVAMEFHALVSDLQRGDVERFEEEQKKQAAQRAALRAADPSRGLNAGDLLKKMDGDPEAANRRIQDELDRVELEAKAAADKQKAAREPLPDGHFPPPPENG